MESLWQWGIDIIINIQQIQGPALNSIFRAITLLGDEEFYLLLLPLILWCVDFRFGARLAILFLLSTFVSVGLKDLFQQPRPFNLESSIQLSDVEGYGLPSNHAQSSVIIWGSIAARLNKPWFWVLAAVLILLISFSRIYLGVHFPTDVMAGWVIGIILLSLYWFLHTRIEKSLVKLNPGIQILLAIAVPVALFLIHPGKGTAAAMGVLAGAGTGFALTYRYVSFSPGGSWWRRASCFLVGGVIIFALYLGLRVLLPDEESAFYLAFWFFHYGVIGIWITLGAPWLFRLLHLTPQTGG